MSKITYQTRLNPQVTQFCDCLGGLLAKIERDLYQDLQREKKLNDLKKSYQIKYGINARQFNLKENGYSSHEDWLKDWQKSRSSQFTLVGPKDETNGNQNCQLLPNGTLKIRVPSCYESIFGKYYLIENVKFSYGQSDVEYALNNGQALTFRIVKKDEKWYVFCSFDLLETPTISNSNNGMLGIDLNPNIIGWSYCDNEGNLKAKGQIKINVRDRSTNQTKAIMGDAVKKLVKLAYKYECPISKVNPAFSSLIGLTKFMRLYGLSSDRLAALVLARRALRKKERIPTNYARVGAEHVLPLQVDSNRHVWSFWNALSKKLRGVKRHSFFSIPNRKVEVKRLDELLCNRFNGKSLDTSITRRDSLSRVVNNSARLTQK